MNIQYISDSNGTPTGVFIPIKDWEEIERILELNSNDVGIKSDQVNEIKVNYKSPNYKKSDDISIEEIDSGKDAENIPEWHKSIIEGRLSNGDREYLSVDEAVSILKL
jgi:hypothetical protein